MVMRMVQWSGGWLCSGHENGAVVRRMVMQWTGWQWSGWCCSEGGPSVSDVLSSHSDHVILCLFAGTLHSVLLQPFSEQRSLHSGDLCTQSMITYHQQLLL